MPTKDGKDKFFKKLNIDEETKKIIKVYRRIKNLIDKEPDTNASRKTE